MPPALREWLPEDHFAWFVLASVEGWICRRFIGRIALMVTAARVRSAVDGRRVVVLVCMG